LHESERKSDKTGKLKLTPTSVDIGGKSYPLDATVDSVQYILKGRGVGAGDIGKGAAGAGIGAIAGKIIGGGTGAIIGGVVGGAQGIPCPVDSRFLCAIAGPGQEGCPKAHGKVAVAPPVVEPGATRSGDTR